jgi:hypothetical protein
MAHVRRYEVVVYNSVVRERGEHHKQFDDKWAAIHYEEVDAQMPDQARTKISARLPAHRGLVIVDVKEVDA